MDDVGYQLIAESTTYRMVCMTWVELYSNMRCDSRHKRTRGEDGMRVGGQRGERAGQGQAA